jgi:hypothetical protein
VFSLTSWPLYPRIKAAILLAVSCLGLRTGLEVSERRRSFDSSGWFYFKDNDVKI